ASDDFQTKKEILDLKDNKIAELEAQNYQYRQLVKQMTEELEKCKEQSNQPEAHQKRKNTLETRSTQLAQKENNHKLARENRKESQAINQLTEILSNAGLLTGKVKKILRNLPQNSSSCEEELNSKGKYFASSS
ncbi:hypothetical protein TNCT_296471, partial [Trichonephila clavata]